MCFFLLYLPNPYAFSSKSYMSLKLVRIHMPILSATFIPENNLVTNYRNYLGSTWVHVLQLHIKESLHNLVNTDPKRQQCAVCCSATILMKMKYYFREQLFIYFYLPLSDF
ncbi:hypothetical protein Ddye_009095 [Dipteronia dyeriana]|uniref:Uncharacterized protein n=1 Tax=Dipteronia dyeriana TaxID=168575 RepID=A0AAD9XAY9_9ROSI|nr:hypothetical protein Ddye_009095 [Dipteronia dyeriana]